MENIKELGFVKIYTLENDKEINWFDEYGVDGLNLSTLIIENTSYVTKGSLIYIFDTTIPFDENDVSLAIKHFQNIHANVAYALYDGKDYLCGFVVYA